MQLSELLKISRNKKNYTQEQVAKKLFISVQAVSKWENGLSMPSIENLLALSDLYDISLDELIQGSPFFRKPYRIGNVYNNKKGLVFLVVWGLLSAFLTSHQPFAPALFLLILFLGILLVFPMLFSDYWVIGNEGLEIKQYPEKSRLKLLQLLVKKQSTEKISYAEISQMEIIYKRKVRNSPFDIGFDYFYLQVTSSNGICQLDLTNSTPKTFLPQFLAYLEHRGVEVVDLQQIIPLLVAGESLFEHFNAQRVGC